MHSHRATAQPRLRGCAPPPPALRHRLEPPLAPGTPRLLAGFTPLGGALSASFIRRRSDGMIDHVPRPPARVKARTRQGPPEQGQPASRWRRPVLTAPTAQRQPHSANRTPTTRPRVTHIALRISGGGENTDSGGGGGYTLQATHHRLRIRRHASRGPEPRERGSRGSGRGGRGTYTLGAPDAGAPDAGAPDAGTRRGGPIRPL
jgi:hypothetical protein